MNGGISKFGGNLSVFKPAGLKPLIGFGQDESILKQYAFTTKAWTCPDGTRGLIPKDEGAGVMISAFASREYGFGIDMSPEDLARVNETRNGKMYSDEVAAKAVNGNISKSALTSNPFVTEFEYGVSGQGYWDYNHMVLQLEDCIDVLHVLNGSDTYDYMFLFDHSSGHDKQRPDGLSVTRMTKYFGGAQAKMRDTFLGTEEVFGTYPRLAADGQLFMGDTQAMQYKPTDRGPYYLSCEDRERQRHDRPTGKTLKKNKTKEMILDDLKVRGINVSGTVLQLKEIAKQNNIPLVYEQQEVLKGWEGQPKGMLQVLWERGFIDASKSEKYYTIEGRKDQFGNVNSETSVKMMMEKQMDFVEEETLLQYHGRQLGVIIDRTPKCHPEMAGEGIEYNWGCAKGFYRRLPITEKRSKSKFRESVKKSISRNIMTTERQRMFSRRAQQYMLAYHAIDANTEKNKTIKETTTANTEETSTIEVRKENNKTTFALIENVIKNYKHTYKTHRSVADSDTGYINKVVMAMKMSSFMQEHQKKISDDDQEQEQQQQLCENGHVSGSASGSASE